MFSKFESRRPVNDKPTSWRNQFQRQLRALTKQVSETMPETISLPITYRKTMFEFGGSAKNFGTAMIVADAKGYPGQGKMLDRVFPNGLHAEVGVWPGCLIGIASYNLDKEVMSIYKIVSINESESKTEFGSADAVLIAYIRNPNSFSGSSKFKWYDNLTEYKRIDMFVNALKNKLYCVDCMSPTYIEWFMNLKNQLQFRKQLFNIKLDWYSSGIFDSEAKNAKVSNTFTELYTSVCKRAHELAQYERNRIIVAVFAHYFAKINENGDIIYLTDPKSEDFTKCTLITEARLVTADSYSRQLKLVADDYGYTFIHKFNEEVPVYLYTENEQGEAIQTDIINPEYFLSDITFQDFASAHDASHVNNILDSKFYQDIQNNLNPKAHRLYDENGVPLKDKDGSQIFKTPEQKINPDTQTNALLYIGSAKAFFSDLRENFSHHLEKSYEETKIVHEAVITKETEHVDLVKNTEIKSDVPLVEIDEIVDVQISEVETKTE